MLYKNNLSLFLSGFIDFEDIINNDITYRRLDSPGSISSIIFCLPFIYNAEAHGFNITNLIEKKSTKDVWGGMELDLDLETGIIYSDYNCYKLTLGKTDIGGQYYISTIEPYLLINWDTILMEELLTSVNLESVEDKIFSESEYNSFVNNYREEINELVEKKNVQEEKKEKDEGIPGFEMILVILSILIILFLKRKKQF
jgi:hypothetical protein